MKKKKDNSWKVAVVALLFCVVGLGWMFVYNMNNKLNDTSLNNKIPKINIELNEISLEEIKAGSKDQKYEGNKVDIYDNGSTYQYEEVEIKGRGNTTWEQVKKPYQIKFSQRVDLLNLGKNKKWVLLANYYDTTFLRNDIALLLTEILEMQYNHRGEFVELYFND